MSCVAGAGEVSVGADREEGRRKRLIIQTSQPSNSNQNRTLMGGPLNGAQAMRPSSTSSTKREPAYDNSSNAAPV
jgi:hypothetical protein